ncbi:MAG: hypothetical protein F4096_00390 [Rhodothermaceae bacterium]|nr:hypothetical protein [Rhodothermaceae bacterium]
MNRNTLAIITILLIARSTPDINAQDIAPLQFKHFERIGTIKFDGSDTLLIGNIEQIDVDSNGRLLITDRIGKQVLLFDSTGTLLASLHPSTCHPAFPFSPTAAVFGNDEFIFVKSSSPGYWGYQFTAEGGCLGRAERSFSSPKFVDTDPEGMMYGVGAGHPTKRMLTRMNSAGKVLAEFPLPPVEFPNAEHRFDHGGLIADGTHIFYASVGTLDILKLDPNGTEVDRFSKRNSWFNSPNKDIPADFRKAVAALKDPWGTTIWNLFELTDQTIMVQYGDRKNGIGYQVFTKDGVLVAEELGLKMPFLHAANGVAYFMVYPDFDGRGEFPNPALDVYRFISP